MNEIGTSGNSRQAYVTNDVTVGRSLFCLAFFRDYEMSLF